MTIESINFGYALPAIAAKPSHAAAFERIASISNSLSSRELRKSKVIVDQNDLPSCVSCALSAAMEVLNFDWPQLAPLFHYYVTRHERGGADSQGFLFLPDSLNTLNKVGICTQKLHPQPFDEAGSRTKPSSEAYADALQRAFGRSGETRRFRASQGLSRANWIREQLRQEHPVIIGFQQPVGYYRSFLNSRFEWLTPDVPLNPFGHCVFVCGYDDLRQALRIQDCHGDNYFDSGYWWMGYRIADSNIVQEAYCLIR